jgi:hypothetical protein
MQPRLASDRELLAAHEGATLRRRLEAVAAAAARAIGGAYAGALVAQLVQRPAPAPPMPTDVPWYDRCCRSSWMYTATTAELARGAGTEEDAARRVLGRLLGSGEGAAAASALVRGSADRWTLDLKRVLDWAQHELRRTEGACVDALQRRTYTCTARECAAHGQPLSEADALHSVQFTCGVCRAPLGSFHLAPDEAQRLAQRLDRTRALRATLPALVALQARVAHHRWPDLGAAPLRVVHEDRRGDAAAAAASAPLNTRWPLEEFPWLHPRRVRAGQPLHAWRHQPERVRRDASPAPPASGPRDSRTDFERGQDEALAFMLEQAEIHRQERARQQERERVREAEDEEDGDARLCGPWWQVRGRWVHDDDLQLDDLQAMHEHEHDAYKRHLCRHPERFPID